MIRKIILVAPVLLLLSFSTGKKRGFTPPGTVQITETFFADAAEINNFSWWEFEFWTKNKYGASSPQHLATLPDTSVWDNTSQAFIRSYYRDKDYRDYPVVGVSYEQAQAFCKWRSDRVREFFYIRYQKELNIEYRLPSRDEWELLTSSASEVFNGGNMVKCIKNTKDSKVYRICYNARCFINDSVGYYSYTSPSECYPRNSFGLYDMIGNVSEMVAEKGISKGGSWMHSLEECRPGKDIPYSAPASWLGFRCVCVVGK